MSNVETTTRDGIRARFASALSDMYQKEVPQYGKLLEIVSTINQETQDRLGATQDIQKRVEVERHGAIRLGTAQELATIRRLFAIMGMQPVGYYDLTIAGLPVHATGFRPLTSDALQSNPFRVFVSLLRQEQIRDETLRAKAADIMSKRNIFTPRCLELIDEIESCSEIPASTAQEFIAEALETFRWHETTTVDLATYKSLEAAHPLIADIVSFRGPHINHLTPRVLDIDAAQTAMQRSGLKTKDVIEGPPPRKWPILLRQTSFLALEEQIAFSNGREGNGKHRARFGEIEQRGMALTRKGRDLYDRLLAISQKTVAKPTGESSANVQPRILAQCFAGFPDDLKTIREEGLAYLKYTVREPDHISQPLLDVDVLIESGVLACEPIIYEDFLPASAAGIFQSNLRGGCSAIDKTVSDQDTLEKALGCAVYDEFGLYEKVEQESRANCLQRLGLSSD
ncbi:hypothetical protein H2198_006833 [Neophaeococcomyces mojaviensis]|uniref:Uncharacterized protein n=1 Tax=Neophaeococcomyces mojaviensis TaxID=3383035 RepID=A0ACC3A1W3_9EURO|nr:hypothetical protein H2198_006833 [Knufia sp. JES_112]